MKKVIIGIILFFGGFVVLTHNLTWQEILAYVAIGIGLDLMISSMIDVAKEEIRKEFKK